MKKTKIICTMGPKTDNKEVLTQLVRGGMDVARFNFSHGDYEEQKQRMELLKSVREELGIPVAILLDTKGPEIRTGLLENGENVTIEDGAVFTFTTQQVAGTNERVSVTYEELPRDVEVGGRILVDDGLLEFEITDITETEIICKTLSGGTLGQRKGINVPNVHVNLPAITDKDRQDILFGIEQGVDFIAASFIRSGSAILEIKELLKEHGAEKIHVIAKIENAEGLENADEIIEYSDGVMVARGDLGVEIPAEQVPHVQKQLIQKCNEKYKPVITATQMLDSMIRNSRPTRAEVTDVANAIYDGTDVIMLSGETAAGKHPVEALKMMCDIAQATEEHLKEDEQLETRQMYETQNVSSSVGIASVITAKQLHARYIVTPSVSGQTTRLVSKLHPNTPIIGMSPNESTLRKMQLYWGVVPMPTTVMESAEDIMNRSVNALKNLGKVETGDTLVITAGVPASRNTQEVSGFTNMMKVAVIN